MLYVDWLKKRVERHIQHATVCFPCWNRVYQILFCILYICMYICFLLTGYQFWAVGKEWLIGNAWLESTQQYVKQQTGLTQQYVSSVFSQKRICAQNKSIAAISIDLPLLEAFSSHSRDVIWMWHLVIFTRSVAIFAKWSNVIYR